MMRDRSPADGEGDDERAEGQAALWLAECLVLALVEAGSLDKESILDAIEVVIAAKRAATSEEEHPSVSQRAIALLSGIANSVGAVETAAPSGRGSQRRRRGDGPDAGPK